MTDIIERVARAIRRSAIGDDDADVPEEDRSHDEDRNWPIWEGEARAAIAAVLASMREPSAGMVDAALCEMGDPCGSAVSGRNIEDIWRAMLGAWEREDKK